MVPQSAFPERSTEGRCRQIIDRVGEVIFLTDAAGNWQLLNPPWTSLTEYSVEESLDRSAFEFIHPDEREALRSELCEMVRSGKSVQRRLRLLTRRGRTRWVDLSAAPSRDASGQIEGAVGTLRDVTANHLRRALDRASRTLDSHVIDDRRISATSSGSATTSRSP
jgi:PAS domain S-box-containing protein